MNARLERMRDDVRTGLGEYFTDNAWPDEVIDQALKQGMQTLLVHFPSVAQEITLTTSGYSHDLAAYITDIYGVIDVTHPWEPDSPCQRDTPYQLVGRTNIQFVRPEPQESDKVRVLYRRFYTIGELDGAATDTLPAEFETSIVIAACSYVLRKQAMQMATRTPAAKPKDSMSAQIGQMAISLMDDAISAIYNMHPNHPNPTWNSIGL